MDLLVVFQFGSSISPSLDPPFSIHTWIRIGMTVVVIILVLLLVETKRFAMDGGVII